MQCVSHSFVRCPQDVVAQLALLFCAGAGAGECERRTRECARFVFRIYDVDSSGAVSEREAQLVAHALCQMGGLSHDAAAERSRSLADRFLQVWDVL